jgi:hypothetical protein
MNEIDHDEFLPPVVKLSTSPYCTYISSQYDGTRYYNSTQHGNQYNSTFCTSLPLPGHSPCTSESIVTVHNDKLLDSAHYDHSDILTSQSLAHLCSDRQTDSIRIVVCSGRQHCIAVLYTDTLSSSQCRTRHLPTGGVPRTAGFLVNHPRVCCVQFVLHTINPILKIKEKVQMPPTIHKSFITSQSINIMILPRLCLFQ